MSSLFGNMIPGSRGEAEEERNRESGESMWECVNISLCEHHSVFQ